MSTRKGWLVAPVLLALLACKGGRSEEEGTIAPRVSAETTATVGSTTVPANANGKGKMRIVESRAFTSESGFVMILGEVINETGSWVDRINVDVKLLDAAGKPIGVSSVAGAEGRGEGVVPERSVLAPGESSPFKYIRDVKKLARPYASHELAARAFAAKYQQKVRVLGVTSVREELGFWKVTGTLTNEADRPCRFPQAVIAFYGADGKLYDVSSAVPKDDTNSLAKGASWSFDRQAALEDKTSAVKSVKVWGSCAQDH
jgi:hypothetical protein